MNSLVLSSFFFFGYTRQRAGSLFPDQELNLRPPALGAWNINHWTAREVSMALFYR